MGNLATPEALLHRWEQMQHDPSLQDLPYKIELNAWGKVEMSPASVIDRTGEKPGSAFPISVSLPDLTKGYP